MFYTSNYIRCRHYFFIFRIHCRIFDIKSREKEHIKNCWFENVVSPKTAQATLTVSLLQLNFIYFHFVLPVTRLFITESNKIFQSLQTNQSKTLDPIHGIFTFSPPFISTIYFCFFFQMYFMESCSRGRTSPVYSLGFDATHLYTATDFYLNVLDFTDSEAEEKDFSNYFSRVIIVD